MRHIFGEGGANYYIAIFPLFAKGGGNLLYSQFPAYPGKGGNDYIAIFPGGGNGSITPVVISRLFDDS